MGRVDWKDNQEMDEEDDEDEEEESDVHADLKDVSQQLDFLRSQLQQKHDDYEYVWGPGIEDIIWYLWEARQRVDESLRGFRLECQGYREWIREPCIDRAPLTEAAGYIDQAYHRASRFSLRRAFRESLKKDLFSKTSQTIKILTGWRQSKKSLLVELADIRDYLNSV